MTAHVDNLLTSPAATGSIIPNGVLDNLAARFRPGGLFLMLLAPDGSVVYHDPAAATFFHRYVLPLIQYGDSPEGSVRALAGAVNANSAVTVWPVLPGVLMAAFPYVERRQMHGILVLAAKNPEFTLGEDVVRVCSRLGLDGIWLNQQADELPAYGDEALLRQSRLLLNMTRDQVRLSGLEQELHSISGQLANTYEELSLIYQLSGGTKINRRPADFFKQACLEVLEVIGVQGMGVALKGTALHGSGAPPPEPVIYGRQSLPPGAVHRLAAQLLDLFSTGVGSLLVNDLKEDKSFQWIGEFSRQLLAVPLQRHDEVLGCLFALDKSTGDFDSVDSKLLISIANQSAIYLENATLFEDVHGLMMGLLHSLTSAVDAKDSYTCGHSERVAALSRRLALEAGLTEPQAERVYMAGLLHDVGKIGVPEAVLQRTGKLTVEEFELMKRHPQIGAKILANIVQIKDIIPGVLYHHERYEGGGYPAGLVGEKIPLMGRLISLADGFDAMTSNRTYRAAMPLEVAMAEIRRCSGTQFDPVLAEAFLRIGAEQFRVLLRTSQEQAKEMVDLQRSLRGV